MDDSLEKLKESVLALTSLTENKKKLTVAG